MSAPGTGVIAAASLPAKRAPRGWLRLLSPLAFLLLWEAAARSGLLSADVIAAPSSILDTFGELLRSGALFRHLSVSLARAGLGLAIGVSLGVVFGLAAGLSRRGELVVDPLMQMLRTLPFLGMIPLFIVWFGIGEVTKIALIALAAKTPVYLTLYGGIRGIDKRLLEAAQTLGLRSWETIVHVVLPGTLPSFFVGLRYALGTSLLALVAVEQINASVGLGYLIWDAREFMRTDVIVVCLLIYSLLGLGSDALVRALERRGLAWRPAVVDG